MKVEFGKAGFGGGLIVDGCFSESKLEILFGFLLLGIFWKNGISGNKIMNNKQ